jgi:hypothetical protein
MHQIPILLDHAAEGAAGEGLSALKGRPHRFLEVLFLREGVQFLLVKVLRFRGRSGARPDQVSRIASRPRALHEEASPPVSLHCPPIINAIQSNRIQHVQLPHVHHALHERGMP